MNQVVDLHPHNANPFDLKLPKCTVQLPPQHSKTRVWFLLLENQLVRTAEARCLF